MRLHGFVLTMALLAASACGGSAIATRAASPASADSVRANIAAAIERGVDATRRQNIEAYMAELPIDLTIRNDSGRVLTREELRADALRSWSIIPKTIAIAVTIDSLHLLERRTGGVGDSAHVWTSQRWERLMLRRDGVTVDTVLTTQKHRETWRRTALGWRQYFIEELGGLVWLNGKPYTP